MAKKKEVVVEEVEVVAEEVVCSNCLGSGLRCSVCHADGGNPLE